MTPGATRALGHPNDTARLLCLMHEIAEGAWASVDLDDINRLNNIADAGLSLADIDLDDAKTRELLLYIASQAVAWLLVIDRRSAA